MEWITTRLFQVSTIKGIIQLAGSLGILNVDPSTEAYIVAIVMGILGVINVYNDQNKAAKQAATKVATTVATNVTNRTLEDNGISPTPFENAANQVRTK